MKNKKDLLVLAGFFSLAFLIRYLYLAFLQHHYFFIDHPSSDVQYYQAWGTELMRFGWGAGATFWGLPLYAYFLAILKSLTLNNAFLLHLAHFFLGALNCLLVFHVAQRFFSKSVAYLACLLTILNFSLIFYDWLMMPVTILITLSLIIILALEKLTISSEKTQWFFLGILLGLATTGDGKFLIFTAFLILFFLIQNLKEINATIKKMIIPLIIGFFVLPGLMTLRNKIVYDDWVFISPQSGLSFYVGNNISSTGIFKNPDFIRPTHEGQDQDQRIVAEQILQRKLKPSEVSSFWWNQGISFIKRSPQGYLKLLTQKLRAFISDDESAYEIDLLLQKKWKDLFDFNPYKMISPLAFLGILIACKRKYRVFEINLLILSQLMITLIFFVTHRHRATILPFLIIYEAFVLTWFWEQIQQLKIKSIIIFCIAFLCLAILGKGDKIGQNTLDFLKFSKSGPVLVERKEFQAAEVAYQSALNILPNDTNTLYNLGTLYAIEKRWPMAIDLFQKTLEINPLDPNVLFNLAFSYQQMGNVDFALIHYRIASELQPDQADSYFQMAHIYSTIGNCELAEVYYEKVARILPHLANQISSLIIQCPSE